MSSNRYKVLLIEDEANIRSYIGTTLEINDYQTIHARTCAMGKTMYNSHNVDLVILDLGLSDEYGIEFIKYVRETAITPIIVLSARTDEKDKVTALDLGANNYITKPFSTVELLARIRATIRNSHRNEKTGTILGNKFIYHDLEIDYDKRNVKVKDIEINLTQTEYDIMDFLSRHPGKVLTYSMIIKYV